MNKKFTYTKTNTIWGYLIECTLVAFIICFIGIYIVFYENGGLLKSLLYISEKGQNQSSMLFAILFPIMFVIVVLIEIGIMVINNVHLEEEKMEVEEKKPIVEKTVKVKAIVTETTSKTKKTPVKKTTTKKTTKKEVK